MSEHSGGGNTAGCFLTLGISAIPVAVAANLALDRYLVKTYGALEKVPFEVMEDFSEIRVAIALFLVLALVIVFPMGIYVYITGMMEH